MEHVGCIVCGKKGLIYCNCRGKPTVICSEHIECHLVERTKEGHTLTDIYRKLGEIEVLELEQSLKSLTQEYSETMKGKGELALTLKTMADHYRSEIENYTKAYLDLRRRISSTKVNGISKLTENPFELQLLGELSTGSSVNYQSLYKAYGFTIPAPHSPPTLTHCQRLISLDISPTNDLLATGDSTGHLTLWSLLTWSAQMTIATHKGPLSALKFFPNGNSIASVAEIL